MNWVRSLITFVLGALLCGFVDASTARDMVRVGFLRAEAPDVLFAPFRDGMRDFGYVEGRNLIIEQRWANGNYADLARLAQQLVDLKVDVILATCGVCTDAARRATQTIPIVTVSGDPVGMHFVSSLARPGGNVTGLTLSLDELCIKRLELLKELAPATSKVAVLWSAQNPLWEGLIDRMNRSAPALGMHIEPLKIVSESQIESTLAALAGRHNYALYVFEDPVIRGKSAEIIAYAAKHRMPAIYGGAEQVRKGGLISYAPSFEDLFRRAAGYVVRILKGAKPGELPLQQPTKYELVVNVKTAKAIGLAIPESILQRADEIIQ